MTKKSNHKGANTKTRRAIVNLLKQEGAMDSQQLAGRLGVSAMAVRQHLYALCKEKLINYQEKSQPMGRPVKLWQLTPAANRLFPDGYAELTLGLIDSMIEAFGETGLERLLEIKTRKQIADYQTKIPIQDSPSQKVAALADLRTDEGYMAEIQTLDDNSFLLIENHCPICAAATACTGLCEKELEIFQTVLGKDVSVKRTEHILAGARRCAYRISSL